jgi:prepilin-type N-terminal cleavage/methylation domain-containing protein
MTARHGSKRGETGFTFIEIMIVVMLIGFMAVWGYPALLKTLNRLKLTQAARESSIFMQRARMEAVKRGGTTEVNYLDAATCSLGLPCMIAFADLDGDGAFIAANDVLIAGPYPLPTGIKLWGPLDASAEGANAILGWDEGATPNDGPIFQSDGSAESAGAFRFRDPNGNFLEVRIEFLGTGKPTIKKWFGGGNANTNWFENGENGNTWQW